MTMTNQFLDISPEVQSALQNNLPVVALESTIISHGMPYPRNIETAGQVEKIVRTTGAIPATIAILQGRLKVGLNDEELAYLGKEKTIHKVSRRDLPYIVTKKLDGATTVASTMIIAHLAGIKVFVTGGIGGVHRGASETFDISADLSELAQTSVAVVCAGVKSILDIGATLEYLETHGVPVFGYKTAEFPAFYTRRSGFGVDHSFDSTEELAVAIKTKWGLGLKGGLVIGNPIPAKHEMAADKIDNAISKALNEAQTKGIKGKEVTPFLLSRIVELTGSESLKTNIQLVLNNAEVGARLAINLSELNQ